MAGLLNKEELETLEIKSKSIRCGLCENKCQLTIHSFNDNKFFTGNRCDKPVSKQKKISKENIYEYKYQRLFDYAPLSLEKATNGTIGLPRALNIYESYPFWFTFFTALKFQVNISPMSKKEIYELGMDSVPSESMCYPAKLVNGHVQSLINSGLKFIFYPSVIHENTNYKTDNKFNCPIVISYPEVIDKNMDSLQEEKVNFFHPFLSFSSEETLTKELMQYTTEFKSTKSEIKKAAKLAWNELEIYRSDVQKRTKELLEISEKENKHAIVLAGRPYHLDPEINHGIDKMVASLGFIVLSEDAISELEEQNQNLRAYDQWVYHSRLYKAAGYAGKRKNIDIVQLNSFGCGIDAITTDQVQEILAHHNKIHTVLKIDEGDNLGAAKIRMRSLKAAIDERRTKRIAARFQDYNFDPVKIEGDLKDYKLLCPDMSPMHFEFIEKAAQLSGYDLHVVKDINKDAIDIALRYVNNDACYPTLCVIGQLLQGISKFPKDEKIALLMTQTGGGCRATNYIALLRKALVKAGYENVPVVALQLGKASDPNKLSGDLKFYLRMVQSIIYGDTLMRLVLRMRPYEINKGQTEKLQQKYTEKAKKNLENLAYREYKKLVKEMIKEFDAIPINEEEVKPKVGIVGEIYVKYHPTANNQLIKVIEDNGGQAIVPDMLEFFLYGELSKKYMAEEVYFKRGEAYKHSMIIKFVEKMRQFINTELERSRHFDGFLNIKDTRKAAEEFVNVGNHTGEGWFLTGEMVNLIHHDVPNIACIQPFGCLPNHIVGKGMFKAIREKYPMANIMPIDFDPGASEVNQISRIKLMLTVAKRNLA